VPLDKTWYAGFSSDLHDPSRWETFYNTVARKRDPSLPARVPPLPKIDAERMFLDMMRSARAPDPWMFPALQALRKSGKFIIAALSNTVIFPPGHELAALSDDPKKDPLRSLFDVFISSAHVGLRKPDPRIYQLALKKVDEFARANAKTERGRAAREEGINWEEGVRADEIVFLDDIGENLKAAKNAGFGTIKVPLGRAYEAVDELEKITGLKLAGDHPKVPLKADYKGKARL